MKKIGTGKIAPKALFIMLFCFTNSVCYGQIPSASALFEKMKNHISSIQTVSYHLKLRHVNALGGKDSVFEASSVTWVERVPADTVYGAYFHVKQRNKYGDADFYYDGNAGIDIYHTHIEPALAKNITVIEPFRMSHGLNAVQTAATAMSGYFQEMLSPKLNLRWHTYLDLMTVSDDGKYWLVQWKETSPDNYQAQHRLFIDKETYLIHQLNKQSTWNGLPENLQIIVENICINQSSHLDSVTLKNVFANYKVNYLNRKNYGKSAVASQLAQNHSRGKGFCYTGFDGNVVSLLPQNGKLLLLDFWETWCGACFVAMPKLKTLYEQYKGKGLEIVAVVTENKDNVRKIVTEQKFPYPTVFADEQVKRFYKLESRPRYILLDSTGTIVADSVGDLDYITSEIKHLLK
jgi:thiol-disulfide isomerase/thioredoxin